MGNRGKKALNIKMLNITKNISYTLMSNLLSLIVSTMVVLIIPKLIGVEDYGYWQLYLFYSTFIGFLHFGWSDGIYLKYGGKEYRELDKGLFNSQFYMLIMLQLVLAIFIYVIAIFVTTDMNKILILRMIAICTFIVNIRSMLLFVLQGTNRIKEYAHITIMDRLIYCIIIVSLLLIGIREFTLLIVSDLIGKLLALIYAMYCCREIVFRKISTFYFSVQETIDNINIGIKLLTANIASMLVVGVVRLGIEHSWDITTFGKVSLTLSISSLMMIFINALGIVMYPILRKTNQYKYSNIYIALREIVMMILLGLLIVYYPLKIVLLTWLPQYSDSLKYMALVFPICVYEGKMSLLVNTFLKVMREEMLLLKINIISLIFSIVVTIITTIIFKNLNLAIISILVLIAFRCILAEKHLNKLLKIPQFNNQVIESIMTLVFVFTGWFINSWIAFVLYTLTFILYLIIRRNNLKKTIIYAKALAQT
ncbi:MAG: oligosaccharide flippase family protein [Saccharofermentanales bacterium]